MSVTCETPLKITIVGTNKETKEAIFFNPRCKKWDCEYCAEKNREEWVWCGYRGARLLAEAGSKLRFITVTSRPHATVNQSLYFFKENWPRLVRRAAYHTRKQAGQDWQFLLIPERHKTGKLHAHIVATTHLTKRWWKDNAHACGFGYMADSQKVAHVEAVAGYITKYLGKSMAFTQWPKGFRRVRTSRGWPKTEENLPTGFSYEPHNTESAWFEYYLLQDYGYSITDRRNHEQ